MRIIEKLLLVLLVHLFVGSLKGQELTAEVLSVRLPKRMAYTASIYDGQDSIYIIGGYIRNEGGSKEILKLSLTNESITQVALLPSPRYRGSAVIDDEGENIYYFGGYDEVTKQEIYKFNLATKSVTLVGNLTSSNEGHAAIKYTDDTSKVFLIGGFYYVNLIQCWDIDLSSNCPRQTIDTYFKYTGAVSYGAEAFVFGDANGTSGGKPVYKMNLNTFETSFGVTTLPDLIRPLATVIVGSNSYIIGGWVNQTNFTSNTIIQVDLESLKVTALPVNNFIPNESRYEGASAVYVEKFNRIYIIGGYSDPYGIYDEIWAIDLSPVSPTTIESISSSPQTITSTITTRYTSASEPTIYSPT